MKNKIALASTGFIGSVVSGEFVNESIKIYEEQKEMIELARELMYDKPTKKQLKQVVVPVRTGVKHYRNEPCPCGSGLKYKKCCINPSK